MRKRHAARPTLESMEDRMVPSALAIFDPTAGIRAAISALESHPSHATPAAATHHATTKSGPRAAARAARHQAAAAATAHHTTTHHSSSSSSSSSSPTSSLSSFLKSIGF